MERGSLDFQYSETEAPQLIKVVGVGGGGGNAVNKMCTMGTVPGVSFLLCNTDAQALSKSAVPERIVIGPSVTQGLGAGNKPERARAAAEESHEVIQEALTKGDTRMVFITAGMGGGTGTGAAPVIGRIAMQAGLLTIGIVTIPFLFEGKRKILQALDGVKQMRQSVDALLVVNNERLKEIYSDYSVAEAFRKADDTLTKAVRSIVEIINMHGTQNLDFHDVDTCLRGGGVAIMSSGFGRGDGRMTKAFQDALESPLLNDREVKRSRSLRVAFFYPPEATGNSLMMDEMQEVDSFMEGFLRDVDTKWGMAEDPNLTDEVKVTILASGFRLDPEEEEEAQEGTISLEEMEHERALDERRRQAYGDTQKRQRYNRIFLFSSEDLENEKLLEVVDALPVYKRTENDIRHFRSIANQAAALEVMV